MKYIKYILPIYMLCLLFSSCSREETLSQDAATFSTRTNLGFFNAQNAILEYRKFDHQVSINRKGTKFRLQDDNQSILFACEFTERPSLGKSLEIKIETQGLDADSEIQDTFKVIKESEDKVWLWSENGKYGIICLQ